MKLQQLSGEISHSLSLINLELHAFLLVKSVQSHCQTYTYVFGKVTRMQEQMLHIKKTSDRLASSDTTLYLTLEPELKV